MRSEKQLNVLAELAFIKSLPVFLVASLKPGRLKTKCVKLSNLLDIEFSKFEMIKDSEMYEVKKKIMTFSDKTKWEGKAKHVVTIISFLLQMIEESDYKYPKKIVEVLNEMFEYFDRAGRSKYICMKAGTIAQQKWKDTKNVKKIL